MDAKVFAEHFDLEDTHWWFRSKRTLVFTLLRRYGVDAGPGLDVGSGAGGTLARLSAQGAWFGGDADPAALELSRRRGRARRRGGRAPFAVGRLPPASASISCITGTWDRRPAFSGSVTGSCARAACSS